MKVALLGLGSVGRGVAEMLAKKDLGFVLTGIADSKSAFMDPAGIDIARVLAQKKKSGSCGDQNLTAEDVVKKADYDILIEVTPTNALSGEPAIGYIKAALARKKHVVTSNKGPIALAAKELRAMAKKKGVSLRYEATVAGAIPVMHTLEQGLAGNEILALYGVLNGTCNFILTRMAAEGLTQTPSAVCRYHASLSQLLQTSPEILFCQRIFLCLSWHGSRLFLVPLLLCQ